MSSPYPPGYPSGPTDPGGPVYPPYSAPPPRPSQTPLIVAVTVVVLALIGLAAFLLTRSGSDRTAGESFQTPAVASGPASLREAPAETAAPPAAAPSTAAQPDPSGVPQAAAGPSGEWSSASPDIGQDCSRPGGTPIPLTVTNRLNVPLTLYLVDEACEAHEYATISPGSTVAQQTTTGTRWDVGDGVDMTYAAFVPTESSTDWVVQ